MDEPRVAAEIIEHYQQSRPEDRRLRVGLGRLELLRTQELIRRHLGPGRRQVLDVGGASGVHAEWLAADGHRVHVVDPVPLHVEQATELGRRSAAPFTAEVGDARRLAHADGSVDVVLLLGPLYHLVERADRVAALDVVGLFGVEGISAWLQRSARGPDRDAVVADDELAPDLDAARLVEQEPAVVGVSPHLLLVARRGPA